MWYCYQNRYINQWNKTKSPEINPCIYCQLTLTRLYCGEFIVFLTNNAETRGYPHVKMNLEPYSYHVQNNSKQIKDLNVRADIMKLLKENRDVYTHDFGQAKLSFFFFFKFYFIFRLYITVLVLPNIKMNPPQVYMCSPS